MAVLKFDILILRQTGNSTAVQTFYLNNDGGTLTTAGLKLAQRFAMELMTELGSMQYLPARGTDFVSEARSGRLKTEADVFASFSAAKTLIARNLSAEETNDDLPEEKFEAATISKITIGNGTLSMTVEIVSKAGILLNINLPIDFTIQGGR